MAIQKISRDSISDQVFVPMKEQILEGEWKPGEKIPSENELARQFGVSRVTVRNALQKLSALELLETRFGEGSFVRSPDAASVMSPLIPAAYLNDNGMEEILQLRRMIEGPVCGEACRRASEEDVKEYTWPLTVFSFFRPLISIKTTPTGAGIRSEKSSLYTI